MPPNIQQDSDIMPMSFTNSFWSKDNLGMKQLLNYMKSTHDDLYIIYTIYTQRSQLEQEFGEKLLSLSSIQEIDEKQSEKGGVPAAYYAIAMELQKTATSHLELSDQLNKKVTSEFEQKLDEYRLLLEKWTKTLDELYNERQEKTIELLKIRAKYLKEHDMSKGQSTPTMEKLKAQYKSLVAVVDELSQEWNTTWKDACEVMEAMEEDRVELLKSNVWEYANLASARLLIEDEWCETIRKQLEKCSVEQEIERCISIYGTGSKIPTTNEYVGEQMKEQKKKVSAQQQVERSLSAPTPPAKPPRQQEHQEKQIKTRATEQKQVSDDRTASKIRQSSKQREDIRERSQQRSSRHQQHQPQQESDEEEEEYTHRPSRPQQPERQFDNDDKKPGRNEPQQQQPKQERSFGSEGDEERMNQIRNKVSENMGSTAARGQIKRKPLNKSLMDQVSNQMALARQQRKESEQQEESSRCPSPESSVKSDSNKHKKTNSDGSLDSLLKAFEVVNPSGDETPSPPPIAAVSDEARFRRQPSEYKPDTGSIPTRRGTANRTTNRVLQEITTNDSPPPPSSASSTSGSGSSIQDPYTHPIAAPKSPRPPAQQISADIVQQQQQAETYNHNYQPADIHNQYTQQQPSYQPSPHMMHHQIPDPNAMYSHQQQQQQQQQQYIGQQPQYMGRQHMNQPPRSPMMQAQRSPMMQPQRSPMMQPQRSPMMQPQRSPMVQPLHSPIMQQQQPVNHFGTQRGSLPPPITIPVTNYGVTPQPSPNMAYTNVNGGGVSPGGVLPPPVYNQQQTRPSQYSDGRNILFWVRSKYDYTASDQGELSFTAHTLIGIVEADMTQQTWWTGAIWDDYRHTWSSIAGSIPSNFMVNA